MAQREQRMVSTVELHLEGSRGGVREAGASIGCGFGGCEKMCVLYMFAGGVEQVRSAVFRVSSFRRSFVVVVVWV